MGLIRRPGKGDGSGSVADSTNSMHEEAPLPEIDARIQEQAQEVMKDHLEIMKDIVMRIRYQDGYAKSMYANCPRLQHLLDKNPDLRPVFEDPRLVRINFETVYKEAGGVLPEDEDAEDENDKKESLLVRIAKHPLFKFLKVLILMKKVIGCITGGGIAIIGGCIAGMTDCCTDCCCEEALEELGDEDDISLSNMDAMDIPVDPNTEALNSAADYMEDPEVQEQMQRLLEDPDNLADAIENDTELRSLRDSNPLCAELMQDPETMRILVDPDNLRALGEAPSLIEADFADPGGFIPESDFVDIETGGLDGYDVDFDMDPSEIDGGMDGLDSYDVDYDDNDIQFDMEDDAGDLDDGDNYDYDSGGDENDYEDWDDEDDLDDDEVEIDDPDDADDFEEEEEDEGGWEEDFELEDQDVDADGAEAANKGKGKAGQAKQKSQAQNAAARKGGMGGLAASLGVAATDLIASQIVGSIFGDVGELLTAGSEMGGGPDLGAIEDAGDLVDDDMAGLAEDAVDDVEENEEESDDGKKNAATEQCKGDSMYDSTGRKIHGYEAAAVAGGGGAVFLGKEDKSDDEESYDDSFASVRSDEDEFDDERSSGDESEDDKKKPESKKKKKFFGALKDLASATATTAKESLAAVVLGDDLAEMLVEKQEEMAEGSDSDDADEEKGKKDGTGEDDKFEDEEDERPKSSKRRGLFRRK